MSQKQKKKYIFSNLFIKILEKNHQRLLSQTPQLSSLERARRNIILNTGNFYKKITFFTLALNEIVEKKYRLLKVKSIIKNLWNMIAAYNVIF